MLYTVALLIALSALAGVIAYAGDRLGTMVGRKRLSLFGWRPKRTGQVVGVAVGILIMLSTLGVLSLAFREAAQVLLNAQQASRELASLKEQQTSLEARLERTQSQLRNAEAERELAQAELAQAEQARDDAVRDASALRQVQLELQSQIGGLQARVGNLQLSIGNLQRQSGDLEALNQALRDESRSLQIANSALEAENRTLQTSLGELNGQIERLQNQTLDLRQELAARAQELSAAREQMQRVSRSTASFREGEVIYSERIDAATPEAVRDALAELVAGADRVVLERGATALAIDSREIGAVIARVIASPGDDVVAFVSTTDQFGASRVSVRLEAHENRQLLAAGQLVLSRSLHLGTYEAPLPRDDLRTLLARLSGDAIALLQDYGVLGDPRAVLTTDIDAFARRLGRLAGPVVVGVVAPEPVRVSGAVRLELVLIQ